MTDPSALLICNNMPTFDLGNEIKNNQRKIDNDILSQHPLRIFPSQSDYDEGYTRIGDEIPVYESGGDYIPIETISGNRLLFIFVKEPLAAPLALVNRAKMAPDGLNPSFVLNYYFDLTRLPQPKNDQLLRDKYITITYELANACIVDKSAVIGTAKN